jgi:hypothetical protein
LFSGVQRPQRIAEGIDAAGIQRFKCAVTLLPEIVPVDLDADPHGLSEDQNRQRLEEVREAAVRAVGLVDWASSAFLTKRDCFACHSHVLTIRREDFFKRVIGSHRPLRVEKFFHLAFTTTSILLSGAQGRLKNLAFA